MNVRTTLFLLALFSLATIGAGGIGFYVHVRTTAISEAEIYSRQTATSLAGQISIFLERQQKTTLALAGAPDFATALRGGDEAPLGAVNGVLDHACATLAADVCYLMDASGRTIASSNRLQPTSFVGKNYGFRPYFKEALKGAPSIYLALGVTSKKRGIYTSAPVQGNQRNVLGVLVIKTEVDRLEEQFNGLSGIVTLTDEAGVVFASNHNEWRYQSLWQLSEREAENISKTRQYGTDKPNWLGMERRSESRATLKETQGYIFALQEIPLPKGWLVGFFYQENHISAFSRGNHLRIALMAGFIVAFLLTGVVVGLLYRMGVRDLNQRLITVGTLRENQALLETLVNTVPNGIFVKDLQGRFIMANQAFAGLHGFTPASLIGLQTADLGMANMAARDILVEMDKRAIEAEALTEEPHVPLTAKDGTTSIYHVYKMPLRGDGQQITGIIGVVVDVTDRVRAEEKLVESLTHLRMITDSLPLLITHVDMDVRLRFINREAAKWLNAHPRDLVGKSLKETLGDAYFARLEPRIRKVLGGESVRFEEENEYKDGKQRTIDLTYVPSRGSDGQVQGFFGIAQDITEKRKMESSLRQAQKLEAIGQLAGGIAHEFNNLLQMMLGFNELAMRLLEPGHPALEKLKRAGNAGQRGAVLVKQLLGFSRREMLRPALIDINHLITSFGAFLKTTLGEQITLKYELEDKLPSVVADQGALEQIIMNLVLNSRDAMPNGGTVTIATSHAPNGGNGHSGSESGSKGNDTGDSGNYVQISVTDTGDGMNSEVLDHIFEPFYTTKGPNEGSGLGLSMVYGLVEQHEGYTSVESAPGLGTTFHICLPSSDEHRPEMAIEGATTEKERTGEGLVLLAEDEITVREITRGELENAGFRVLEASDGKEALSLFAAHGENIRLLVLDVIMPDMTGVEVFNHIAKSSPGLPVIFQTGYDTNAIDAEILANQFVRVLNKPYSMQALHLAIHEVLGLSGDGNAPS